jgi:tRNA threonylcarbamoyladenosine biosynthesis protein TsaE
MDLDWNRKPCGVMDALLKFSVFSVSSVAKAFDFDFLSTPMNKVNRFLANEEDTLALGRALAPLLEPGMVLHLRGDLGAGKTTLARGILRGLGHEGRVKSPTYTLVEPYQFSRLYLYHFDFYRFLDPEELANSGFRDYFNAESVCLVEWPEKAPDLPAADLDISMRPDGEGREIVITAHTEAGRRCLDKLTN